MGGKRRSNRTTQPVQTAPMGGDVGYGEGEEARSAQAEIGLPNTRTPVVQGQAGPVATATPGPPVDALDAARAYTPSIMPLNAEDDMPAIDLMSGIDRRKNTQSGIAKQQRTAATIKVFEDLVNDHPEDPNYELILQNLYMQRNVRA